jgi:oxygen-independent coproporphyrinogen-3 oxidase
LTLDLDRLEEILPRYLGPGPRYTSYPTAPVWTEEYGVDDFRRSLGATDPARDVALYTHVPFCDSLCHFCACNKVITKKPELPVRFLEVVRREIGAVREAMGHSSRASQLHWGGGTPTHLTPEQIELLFGALTEAFPLREGAEVSIEVDPRVTTKEQMDTLASCGFNRISMGVQDTNPKVQEAIHRIQPIGVTAGLTEQARSLGFSSVNFDLIYGLPYQTVESFSQTLDEIIAIRPDRLALYSYAHVTWVAKQQRGFERKDLPDATTKIRIMVMAIRRFLDEGYRHIGMDHFALPSDELSQALDEDSLRRNFMGYTTQEGVDVLAFGPSAISELGDAYAQSQRELGAWQDAVTEGGLATLRGHVLTDEDRRRSWLIARIMCHGTLRASDYGERFGGELARDCAEELERLKPLIADELVSVDAEGNLEVLPTGRLLVRNIAMAFDAYLPEQQLGDQPMFSKTV